MGFYYQLVKLLVFISVHKPSVIENGQIMLVLYLRDFYEDYNYRLTSNTNKVKLPFLTHLSWEQGI